MKGDLSAGLTVGVMLIPQGMAYAMIAGLPPIYGLYASTVPLILYAIFGTSRQLAVGPVAMVSLLTATGIGMLAEGGTETYIALAIALAVFVGLIQFLLGAFRLGFLVNFLSHPVISGFTSAAALIIGLSQLKHLLGVDLARSHHVHEIVIQAAERFGEINWITFALGLAGVAIIMLIKRLNRAIPGPLLAVFFGILAVWGFGLTDAGVKIVGEVPKGLPSFGVPSFNLDTLQALAPIALAISLVSFMESIAVAKAIQAKHRNYKVEPNQELISLGLANIGGAFFQSYPTTGGFSRTAVNDQAGAKTGMASIISAGLIILTLLFLTSLFYYLPNAILASVIMVAVFGLIDVNEAVHLWHSNRTDFVMLLATFLATLTLGIEQGIGIGVVLSLAMVIYRTTRPHVAVLGRVPGTHFYRNVERFPEVEEREDLLILRFDAQLYFANINYFKDKLEEWMMDRKGELMVVILNAESINYLDSSAIHVLDQIIDEFRAEGIDMFFTGVKGPVRDAMAKGHLLEKIGENNFFMSVQEAVDCYEEKCAQRETEAAKMKDYVLQTNKFRIR
jgi:SulP family sulfate permease